MKKNLKIDSKLLEPIILSGCNANVSLFLKVKRYLDTSKEKGKSYFSDEKYQIVFNLLCKWFDKFEKLPSENELKLLIEKIKNDDKEWKFLLNVIITNMFKEDANDVSPQYLEEELINFIKENRVYEAFMQSQNDIDTRNFAAIADRMEEAVRVSFDKDLGLSIRNLEEAFNEIKVMNEEECMETGYSHLDSILDGGLHPKEIYCISAIPGGGKTLLLGNIGINHFLKGKKVLVYTFETSRERLNMRFFSNLARMNKKEILLDEINARKKIKQIIGMTEGDLIIKEYGANSVSSNDLMAHINDLWRYKKWKPDLIIADYILIMKTNDSFLSSDNSYRYYKIVTEELRNIGKTLYIPVLTACQINREGMSDRGGSKGLITAKDISESRGIFDTVDFFSIMMQTARDKEQNRFYLGVDKNRNDKTGVRIEFNVNYDHMLIKEGSITS